MIVVTGPMGNTGSLVVEGLAARGVQFRAMTRSAAKRKALAAKGINAVHGDFAKPETLAAALEGADAAYLVCTPDERLIPCETAFIAAAKAAGVEHVVKCSAYAASHDSASPNLRAHAVIEDALRASGMRWTILRPHGFMQTFFWMSAPFIMQQGVMSYPAANGPIPLIDVRDVGAIAVKALTEPGFDGQAFDLTGPEALTPTRQAAILSRAFGKPVMYVDAPEEALDGAMRQMGVPDAPREHVLWCFREQRAGRLGYTARGHVPFGITLRTYDDFAADVAAGKTGAGPSDFAT